MKPDPTKGPYAVLFAEYATGIVLKKDLTRNLGEGAESVYTYFEDLEEAKAYVMKTVMSNDKIEGIVSQPGHEAILFYYDLNGERSCD